MPPTISLRSLPKPNPFLLRALSTSSQSTSTALAPTDPLSLYRSLVARGEIQSDPEQIRALYELRKLHADLRDYVPPLSLLRGLDPLSPPDSSTHFPSRGGGVAEKWKWLWGGGGRCEEGVDKAERAVVRVLSGEEALEQLDTPKGLLLTGPPGTGKSLLASLFLSTLPTPHKSRHHYHAFLLSLYARVWRETQRAGEGKSTQQGLAFAAAREILLETGWVLYLDELQLLDISSAVLFRDTLTWFLRLGGVLIATSNRRPGELYTKGVARTQLLPFLRGLEARCAHVEVGGRGSSAHDWRRVRGAELPPSNELGSWFGPGEEEGFEMALGEAVARERDELGAEKVGKGEERGAEELVVYGRRVVVPWAKGGVARFEFAELCDQALGPADYLALAARFHTLAIANVPVLPLSAKNQARRFITLIDALYESHCRLIVLSAAAPDNLFFPPSSSSSPSSPSDSLEAESLSEAQQTPYRPNVSSYSPDPTFAPAPARSRLLRAGPRKQADEEPGSGGPGFADLAIFTGEEERFAYRRAVSRLVEMSGRTWTADHPARWAPVHASHRPWEPTSLASAPPPPSTPQGPPPSDHTEGGADFAEEAAYVRVGRRTAEGRERGREGVRRKEDAPRLAEAHFWGVKEDWGRRAGRWGMGIRAFEQEKEAEERGERRGDGSG